MELNQPLDEIQGPLIQWLRLIAVTMETSSGGYLSLVWWSWCGEGPAKTVSAGSDLRLACWWNKLEYFPFFSRVPLSLLFSFLFACDIRLFSWQRFMSECRGIVLSPGSDGACWCWFEGWAKVCKNNKCINDTEIMKRQQHETQWGLNSYEFLIPV